MFTISMATINVAFDDLPEREVARILLDVAEKLVTGEVDIDLRDVNGNFVGKAYLSIGG